MCCSLSRQPAQPLVRNTYLKALFQEIKPIRSQNLELLSKKILVIFSNWRHLDKGSEVYVIILTCKMAALTFSKPVQKGLKGPHSHMQKDVTINFPGEFFNSVSPLFNVTSFGVNILLRSKLTFRVFSFFLKGKAG